MIFKPNSKTQGSSSSPVLIGDVEGQDLHWLGALHLPAVASVQPRRLHPQRLLGHAAPGDGAQVLDVQPRRALWGRVGPLAAEETR